MGRGRPGVGGKRQLSHRRRRLRSSLRDQFRALVRLKEGGWRECVCNGSGEGKLGVGGLTPVPPWCLGILTLSLLVVFKWRFEESRQPAEPEQAANLLAAEERFSCGRHFRPRTVELCVLFVLLLHLTACFSARKTGFCKT